MGGGRKTGAEGERGGAQQKLLHPCGSFVIAAKPCFDVRLLRHFFVSPLKH